MAYVRREYPEWSWSFSRHQTFSSCHRKYYYQYYASHNGWEQQGTELATTAYRLKKITNLYTTLDDAVHKVAENLVRLARKGNKLPEASEVEETIRENL